MYRPQTPPRDRAATIAVVVAIHLGLGAALLNLAGNAASPERQPGLEIFDISEPPPPPVVEEAPEPDQAKPKKQEGAASPKNVESKATPVVAPRPRIALPVPVPMPVTETPNTGNEATQGASDVAGPGTGAGGTGNGTGSGGAGSGTGGGGTGIATRPTVVRKLTNADYPDSVIRAWPRGARVFVRVRVQPDGRATDCRVDRSSGVQAIDQWTCGLVTERARFRPATDSNRRPVASWYGYIQADTGVLR